MRYILGIDSGGSKCDALLVRDDGIAIGWGHTEFVSDPPRKRNFGGFGRNPRSVGGAVQQAIKGFTCDDLHIVGLMSYMPMDYLRESHFGDIHLHPTSETQGALALAGVDCGLVVLAGTGALVYGLTRDGKMLHLDGFGPMLGDYGSGFQIGALAVRAAAQAHWHPRHHTSLATTIFNALRARLGDGGIRGLVEFMGSERDRAEIAALARIVDHEARNGDAIAGAIMCQVAGNMAETVRDVVEGLGITQEDYPMVGTGSVITRSDIYWEHLCARVAEFAPRLAPWRSDMPAVLGLVLVALNKLATVDAPTLRENLFSSVRELMKYEPAESQPAKTHKQISKGVISL